MPSILRNNIRVVVPVGSEDVTFICRQPSGREISAFLSSRFVQKRNKVEKRLYEAREEFARSIIVDVENATYQDASDQVQPLNARTVLSADDKAAWSATNGTHVESWLDLIPLTWLASVAMRWEDTQPVDESGN